MTSPTTASGSGYAHDAHCNTTHTPGPRPCPPRCDRDGFCARCDGWHTVAPAAGWSRELGVFSAVTMAEHSLGAALVFVAALVTEAAVVGPLTEGAVSAAAWREFRPDQRVMILIHAQGAAVDRRLGIR